MKLVRILIWLVTSALLTACNLLQSKEEQCLQLQRLQMKDPDSAKVVQNLGDRGQSSLQAVGGFWLRYSATNSYGGRISSNMACEKLEGKWVRSERMEQLALGQVNTRNIMTGLDAANDKLEKRMAARRACTTSECRAAIAAEAGIPDPTGERVIQEVGRDADTASKTAVFEGTGPL